MDEPILDKPPVKIKYTNRKGVTEWREIIPTGIFYGTLKPYYNTPRWLLQAWDPAKREGRTFECAKIEGWDFPPPEVPVIAPSDPQPTY